MAETPDAASEPTPPRGAGPYPLAVIIVNYRTPHLVEQGLDSIPKSAYGRGVRVVVVDNDSGDGSSDRLVSFIDRRGLSSWVRVIETKRNLGFAAGNNAGIMAIDAEAYLLLNSDAYLLPGAIDALLESKTHSDAGLLAPLLEWEDGRAQDSVFRFLRPSTELLRVAHTRLIDWLLPWGRLCAHPADQDGPREWASFACIVIRREVFDAVGLLDDGFFLFFEDVEFCHRAWKAGFSVATVPQARAVHLRGGSAPVKRLAARRERQPAYYYHARRRYFRRCFGRFGPLRANCAWLIGRAVSWPREMLGLKRPHLCRREWMDIWTSGLAQALPGE